MDEIKEVSSELGAIFITTRRLSPNPNRVCVADSGASFGQARCAGNSQGKSQNLNLAYETGLIHQQYLTTHASVLTGTAASLCICCGGWPDWQKLHNR